MKLLRGLRPGCLRNLFRALSLVALYAALGITPAKATGVLTTYVHQRGTPVFVQNFIDPAAGCAWQGVGGQVFDLNRKPVTGLIVRVRGEINGRNIDLSAVTGSAVQFGPGGYEIKLGEQPVAADFMRIKLTDVSGKALSGNLIFSLAGSCSQNLTVVNIALTTFTHIHYLPLLVQ